jgi:peroxiredoxin Q/BCP
LRQQHEEFTRRGAVVVVLGPERADSFAKHWRAHDLPFVGLPDPKHTVLDRFGQEVKLLRFGRMPAQVIVDRRGTIRFAHYGDSMDDIPANEELLEILDGLERER